MSGRLPIRRSRENIDVREEVGEPVERCPTTEGGKVEINSSQPEILMALPVLGRSLTFRIIAEPDLRSALKRLRDGFTVDRGGAGVGEPVACPFGQDVAGLRVFPGLTGPGYSVPSTQPGCWVFLRGKEYGDFFNRTEQRLSFLNEAFEIDDALDTSLHGFARIVQANAGFNGSDEG